MEKARKHALDEAAVKKQLDRLGTTEFSLGELVCHLDEGVMVPMSEINEARRAAVEELTQKRLDAFLPPRKKAVWHREVLRQRENHGTRKHSQLSVQVDTLEKAKVPWKPEPMCCWWEGTATPCLSLPWKITGPSAAGPGPGGNSGWRPPAGSSAKAS